ARGCGAPPTPRTRARPRVSTSTASAWGRPSSRGGPSWSGSEATVRPRRELAVASLVVAALLGGCVFDEPDLEDRWTRLDIEGSNVPLTRVFVAGARESGAVSAAITHRKIGTGFAVTELRASSSLGPLDVALSENAPRLRMATDIDRVLANSLTLGRATPSRAGWR